MERLQLKLGGLHCSFCAETIKKALGRMEGVEEVRVSLAHEEVLISFDPGKVSRRRLKETLKELGYSIRDPSKIKSYEEEERELERERRRLFAAGGVTFVVLAFMVSMWLGFAIPWFKFAMLFLAMINIFGLGGYILKMALQSLRRKILNQHVLLELAAFAGLAGGFAGFFMRGFPAAEFFGVAVFVTSYHILSGYSSLLVRTRASRSVKRLLSLQPLTARVVSDSKEEEVAVERVKRGELVRILPGGSMPVDGEIVEGSSSVDESLVTGEPMPVDKQPGDEVIGGSLNHSGSLLVRVVRVGQESFLQRIASQIEEARAMKPGIIQLVDRVLKYYVPGVMLFALLGFAYWSLGGWLFRGEANMERALFAALAALVMGYPCALGMATPLALIRGSGVAAQEGILMRSPQAFQVFKDVDIVVLDKTGTLTEGKPRVVELLPMSGTEKMELLRLAASAEAQSEHPLARALVAYAEEQGVELKEIKDFTALPGRGVEASVGGRRVRVGSLRYLEERSPVGKAREEAVRLEKRGLTVVGVASEAELLGLIALGDVLKEDARRAVEGMRRAKLRLVMLTGDSQATASAIGEKVGIGEVFAQLLPEEKVERVRVLQSQGKRTAMVGDGINDAPALMQADVGIAIGAGTDIAMESADVVLVGEKLSLVVDAYHIAKRSYSKTVQNLALAFSFNGIGVPLATTGLLHPVWAMVAMVASASGILLNSFAGGPYRAGGAKAGEGTAHLHVPTMHCEKCIDNIKEVLNSRLGGIEVEADLERKLLKVGCSDTEKVREVLAEAGYPAEHEAT